MGSALGGHLSVPGPPAWGWGQVALGHFSFITEVEWTCCLLLYQDSLPGVAIPAVPGVAGAGAWWRLSPWRS